MAKTSKRQQGGTFIGIIIGMVIGLAIALGVALAITNTPTPFTTKVAKPEKPAEAAEAESIDPNKGMYGNKAPARDPARAVAKAPQTAPLPAPLPNRAMEKKPEQKPMTDEKLAAMQLFSNDHPKKPEPKVSDAREAPAKADGTDDRWRYFLQAGAFRQQVDAENARAKLALLGVEARLSERQSDIGTLYRVRVGPFDQLESMNKVRGKLSDNGVDTAVVRISKQ